MKKYIGVKMIEAKPMNLGDYNKYRGWQIPADENPERKGYLVKYEDGYESWSPQTVFDVAYRRIDNMTFGLAVEAMKMGKKVRRAGWEGKYLVLVSADSYKVGGWAERLVYAISLMPWIGMKTADGNFIPWNTSQDDILAEDWMVVE